MSKTTSTTKVAKLSIQNANNGFVGEDVVQENLPADDMLLHFSSLAMHMNGTVVLKKVCAQSFQTTCIITLMIGMKLYINAEGINVIEIAIRMT